MILKSTGRFVQMEKTWCSVMWALLDWRQTGASLGSVRRCFQDHEILGIEMNRPDFVVRL